MSEADGQQSTIDNGTMTAIAAPRYGFSEVLRTEVVPRPVAGDGEVLVRVRAAAVCSGDVHLLTGKPYAIRLGFGLRRPKYRIIGHDLAGDVVAIGAGATGFACGEVVFGAVDSGAFAEYVSVPVERLAHSPVGLTVEEAAALPDSGMTALQGLRDVGGLRAGQTVLINGASGGVGTSAVQIAKALGAEVTAVCSTRHVETLRSLGADRVIDYTTADFTRDEHRYDVLLDLVGNRSLTACRRVLAPKGVLVSSAGAPGGNWFGPVVWVAKVVLTGLVVSQTMRPLLMRPRQADLEFLAGLAVDGKLHPVIERRYPLAEAAAAVGHVLEGHAQGKTVIVV
ncbi:NAD(P)-dependent alcohol dehydrogenase [Nocardia sp. NBC_00508]|uniref:NAD(P)-dependent alcohol dehydrogenase n=1 Tax=Nocardia sp. NBC_00508 TaxID=2975992 RepID=UPI002E803132|nr:NAD(P)-dependent alcohol dehydrogenase [Nocardia sp. NBC_00508]WUD63969.1 NAD(P)-dependent alcohol dehydrogenase [Nocardia sp. NBC_00508]